MRQATVTPAWWAFWVLIKYRTSRNFRTPAYLAARLGALSTLIRQMNRIHGRLRVYTGFG